MLTVIQTPTNQKRQHRCFSQYIMLRRAIRCCTIYMEDLTDMQNHVLPYLQSFCSLEEKGVKERREQQVVEKNESRKKGSGTEKGDARKREETVNP